jgi:hypothetical protein
LSYGRSIVPAGDAKVQEMKAAVNGKKQSC